MDPAVQAFKDKRATRAEAKDRALEGLATATDRDDPALWSEVKALDADLQTLAEAYVRDNPDQFVFVEHYIQPPGKHEELVNLISIFSTAQDEDSVLKLTMFELAHFERQEIGVAATAKLRLGNGG